MLISEIKNINQPTRKVETPSGTVEIHTDASYSWQDNVEEPFAFGIICFYHEEPIVYSRSFKKVPTHKQYSSLFELLAIQKAMEYAREIKLKKVLIVTDSQVCFYWFSKMKNKANRVKTEYHFEIFNEIQKLKDSFDFIDIEWRSRKVNKAGIYLEEYGK